jgi:hypothetical protein
MENGDQGLAANASESKNVVQIGQFVLNFFD